MTDRVFIIEGWFGDVEWIEAVYNSQEDAESRCDELWIERKSENAPEEFVQGLCKFAVVEHRVL